jgi:hypothetical protein
MQSHVDLKVMKRRGMIRLVISAVVSLGLLNHLQVHLMEVQGEVASMGAQRILALRSKRAEISECIRILGDRSTSTRGSLALNRLLERLRQKLEWLDKCIDLEQQQSDPISWPAVAKAPHANYAAWPTMQLERLTRSLRHLYVR